jgi:hypothetical protein
MSLVLNVEILGEYKNLAKATKGAQGSFDKLGANFAKVGKNIAKVTAGIGIGLGVAVASQIKPAIDAASDLSEGINAVNVSFGDAAEGVLKLGENAARGLGLSKTELFGIATQFSSFANTIAGEGGNIVQVVDDISTRGADFASVFNLDVSDALAKFQSGLAGSSEPLRAYGIDLSAASVEAHALEKGIYDGVGAMTESEKVQARYSLLMEQTDKVTGDFANTSDGLANQQRILKAELENTRAEIGEKFMPILNDIQGYILNTVIPAFMEFWDGLVDKDGVAQEQIAAIKEAFIQFGSTFGLISSDITQDQMFKWIGDSIISTIKLLTHLSVFAQEVFQGMDLLFGGPDSRFSNAFSQKLAGLQQLAGAAVKAQEAADAIKFAQDMPAARGSDRRFNNTAPTQRFDQFGRPISQTSSTQTPTTINVNINRAKVDAQDIINDINSRLKTTGSTIQLR